MIPLGLKPLPVPDLEDAGPRLAASWEDFVTTEAVNQVIAGGSALRMPVPIQELVLSSSDLDFAGVPVFEHREAEALPFVSPVWLHEPIQWPDVTETPVPKVNRKRSSRAKPPELLEWESPQAKRQSVGHRWWVPGLAGLAATLMFAGVVFSMAQRQVVSADVAKPTPLRPLQVLPQPPETQQRPDIASTALETP